MTPLKWLSAVVGFLGLLALVAAIIYFTVPAHSLPSFLGPLHGPNVANNAHRKRRGERLDAILSETSENWKLEQMAKVDRIILRIAVYEIAIDRQVPTKAAINESIELAKTFSGEEAGRFVNGILGRVAATAP